MAIQEIQETSVMEAVFFEDRFLMTKEMVASFFEVDIRTIERYISANAEELKQNGYELLRGRELKAFLRCYDEHFGTDIYVGTKTTMLGVFDFRAFLDIAMPLSESEKARAIRQVILDVVIDLINRKTGGLPFGTRALGGRTIVLNCSAKSLNAALIINVSLVCLVTAVLQLSGTRYCGIAS